MSSGSLIKKGVITENPTFVQAIGMCPTLAVTTTAFNGIGMGLAVTAILIMTNFCCSLLRNFIPDKVRIPILIIVIASAVTVVQMLIAAFLPELNAALGIFLSLIVVNCLVMARAEGFAIKNRPIKSAVDGLGQGLGYALSLTVLASIREIIGSGTLFAGTNFVMTLPEAFPRTLMIVLPPGAFITLGLLMAALKKIEAIRKERTEAGKLNLKAQPAPGA